MSMCPDTPEMGEFRNKFVFWEIMPDGTAEAMTDCRRVDVGDGKFFGTIEGAIINGGVKATAFTRKVEQLYDTKIWLQTGKMVPVEKVTITEITAEVK